MDVRSCQPMDYVKLEKYPLPEREDVPVQTFNRLTKKKKRRGAAAEIPQQEVRKDGFDHIPEWRENERNRCKYPGCKSQSYRYLLLQMSYTTLFE